MQGASEFLQRSKRTGRSLPVEPAPLFICGVSRSGTTLLNTLLDSHPSLAVLPGQTHYYRELFLGRPAAKVAVALIEYLDMQWPKRLLASRAFATLSFRERAKCKTLLERWLGWLSSRPVRCLDQLDDVVSHEYGRGGCWGCFLKLYECVANEKLAGKKYWVEKTPGNERFVFLMESVFEKSVRYLHIVRDPRAAVASRLLWFGLAPGPARERELVDYCYGWARSTHQSVQNSRLCPDRYQLLRYEDLVQRSQEIMEGVARFLDIEMDESLLRPTSLGNPHMANSSYPEYQDSLLGIIRTRTQRFNDVLSPLEIDAVETMLGSQMSAFGYEVRETPNKQMPTPRFKRGGVSLKRRVKLRRIAAIQRAFGDPNVSFL